MNRQRRNICIMLWSMLAAGSACASSYPDQPVRLIVPFPAGGPTDAAARILAQALYKQMKTPFVVENRTGAGGTIGTATVAQSTPNGYTLLLTSAAFAPAGAYYSKLPYDPLHSFVGVANIAWQPAVLVVNAQSRYHNLRDFIAAAKAESTKLNYSAGAGGATLTALIAHSFLEAAGIKAQEIPYRGSAPALQSVLTGEVSFDVDLPGGMMGLIGSNRLRALAVSTRQRYPLLPDVPSIAEIVNAKFDMSSWSALLAPAGTPADVVQQLNAAVNTVLRSDELLNAFHQQGLMPAGGSVKEFNAFLATETERWGALVHRLGLSADGNPQAN